MKIAILYDYSLEDYLQYGEEKYWSTPKSIYNAFKYNKLVQTIRSFPLPQNNREFGFYELKKLYDNQIFMPEIILWMSCGLGSDHWFIKNNFPHSRLIVDLGDEPQTKSYNYIRAKNADLVLTPDYECYKEYKQQRYNTIFTAHWADTTIYYPSKTNYCPFDVVTSMNGDRGDILPFLRDKLKKEFYVKTNLIDIENGDLFRNGKIVIQKSRYNEISRRIFEAMACKKLIITNRLPSNKKLDSMFIENKEIIFYDTKEEAFDKIVYYLDNPVEREKIAINGYNKVMKQYTSKNIIQYIIDFYENNTTASC
jgi:hypothetical protein